MPKSFRHSTGYTPPSIEKPIPDNEIREGLRTIREGDVAAHQTMKFCRVMFDAAMLGLIMSREAGYYLTPKGKAFINGEDWSECT